MEYSVLIAFVVAIVLLLILILKLKIQAFLALLIASITGGLLAGMEPPALIDSIRTGMGSTLGFVAVVVGLGALFGAVLEFSGGAQALAGFLIKKFGDRKSSVALVITGFFVSIPVFFDVAFIILMPIVYALQLKSKKSLLFYALPLLTGLAITHAFIPPTPGPVAVAEIIDVELGWVIIAGFIVGVPTAIISGIWVSQLIARKINIGIPDYIDYKDIDSSNLPSVPMIIGMIFFPIAFIMLAAFIGDPTSNGSFIHQLILFMGHPFVALILANLLAWYFLGIRRGATRDELQKISEKSLLPAGIIILLTGAGGVFKQVLVDTGAGAMLAGYMQDYNIPVIAFAFIAASLVRILQGSATVAMITAAGLSAPLLPAAMDSWDKALIVIAISSGATIFSHVNDSGFWLVNRYLGLSVKETFRSWTILTTVIAFTGFMIVLLLSLFG